MSRLFAIFEPLPRPVHQQQALGSRWKRVCLTAALPALLAANSARADQFFYDTLTNYPLGGLTTNTTLWFSHLPGSLTTHDTLVVTNTYTSGAAVSSKHLRINGLNQEYVMRLFDSAHTNTYGSGVIYASFVATANFVPAAGVGVYFAALNGADLVDPPTTATNSFQFRGRIFQIGNTNVYPFSTTVSNSFRLGVANAAGDPAQGGSPYIQYVPVDLVANVDYQVVLKYDIDNTAATIWVNPASESDTPNASPIAFDFGPITNKLAGILFRQRTAGGTMDIRDVAVGTTFADVMTNLPTSVLVATNFNLVTNFPGTPALLEVFASSLGGGPLSYQWYHIAGGLTNAVAGQNNQTMVIQQLSSADTGNYFCAVTNSAGVGAWSRTNYYISVKADAGLSFLSKPPASLGGTIGSSLTLTSSIAGSGPYSIQWSLNGNPLSDGSPASPNAGDNSIVTGSSSPTLVIQNLSTNETGDYALTVTTGAAVSPNSISTTTHVVVNPPKAANVSYLRSLLDTNNWIITDTTTLFAISNAVVTSYTNTSGVGGYYVQDATGGLNLFVSSDPSFVPHEGDIVNAIGVLSSFNHNLEMACYVTSSSGFYSPYAYAAVVGHTNTLPKPFLFSPWSLTNNAGLMKTNLEGTLVTITNVYFPSPGATTGTGSTTLTVTNKQGETFTLFFPGTQDKDIVSRPYPAFAYTITGILSQFLSGTTYGPSGYELNVTRWADINTNPPPAPTVVATRSGNSVNLSWTAVPMLPMAYGPNTTPGPYSYSVLGADQVGGPYVRLSGGLLFNNANATYQVPIGAGTAMFYKVVCP